MPGPFLGPEINSVPIGLIAYLKYIYIPAGVVAVTTQQLLFSAAEVIFYFATFSVHFDVILK